MADFDAVPSRSGVPFFRCLAAREKGENAVLKRPPRAFPLVHQSLMRVLNKMPRETRREERNNAPSSPVFLGHPLKEESRNERKMNRRTKKPRVLRGPHPRSGRTIADDATICICILNTPDISSRPTKLSASLCIYIYIYFFLSFLTTSLILLTLAHLGTTGLGILGVTRSFSLEKDFQ